MDVGNPSNFVRVLRLFDQEFQSLKNVMSSYSFSDEETKAILKEVYFNNNYLLDPHGAIGYGALKKYVQQHPDGGGIFLETAHPVKFDSVNEIIRTQGPVPTSVESLFSKEKKSIEMDVNYDDLKSLVLSKI